MPDPSEYEGSSVGGLGAMSEPSKVNELSEITVTFQLPFMLSTPIMPAKVSLAPVVRSCSSAVVINVSVPGNMVTLLICPVLNPVTSAVLSVIGHPVESAAAQRLAEATQPTRTVGYQPQAAGCHRRSVWP